MEIVYNKYRGKIVRLDKNTVGTVVGYTDSHLILLLEEGVNPTYSFSLDELDKKDYYIDMSFEDNCEDCMYSYCDESNLTKRKNANTTANQELI